MTTPHLITPDFQFTVPAEGSKTRLDKFLAEHCDDLSRARVQALISGGQCTLNGLAESNASYKVKEGDRITLAVPDAVPSEIQAEPMALDIIFEDEDVIVLNKPVGLVVHPGAGNWSGTLVNGLLHHCKGQLSGIGGVERPGIVHRLDKDTSGLMMVAKTDRAHQSLSAQLADRTLSRVYHALVLKVPTPLKGAVDVPMGRHPHQRIKMSTRSRQPKEAKTHYHVQKNLRDALSLVECKLETGRTHQIRVHMEYLKHPLIGDPIYGPQPTAIRAAMKRGGYEADLAEQVVAFPRQALHARQISFVHPESDEVMTFEADYPDDLKSLLSVLLS